jgi:hypothetical protein
MRWEADIMLDGEPSTVDLRRLPLSKLRQLSDDAAQHGDSDMCRTIDAIALDRAVKRANDRAGTDSNDSHIAALSEALSLALELLDYDGEQAFG